MRATTPAQRILVSAFVVFHVAALGWWNLMEIPYRPGYAARPGDVWTKMAAFKATPPGQGAGKVARAYVRGTTLWQQWILFGPDAPHFDFRFEVVGILGFDATGRPILDPEPLHTSADPTVTDRTSIIGNPPCGWNLGEDPKSVFLRGSYARFYARRAAEARGKNYVGAEFRCVQRPVHQPGESREDQPERAILLWAGPLQAAGPKAAGAEKEGE